MSELQIFNFEEEQQVRVVQGNDGEPWFVGSDVAKILGYSNPQKAVQTHCKASTTSSPKMGDQVRHLVVIPERDVYRLIMRSKLPKAEKFEEWVVGEVLPSIRKDGAYVHATPDMSEEEIMARGLLAAKRRIDALEIQNKELQEQNTEMLPKAEFYDCVTGTDTAIDMAIAAKTLNFKNIGRNKMFEFLRTIGVLQDASKSHKYLNIPYQKYVDAGYFRVIESAYNYPDGSSNVYFKTVVYQKGLDYIRKRLLEHGFEPQEINENQQLQPEDPDSVLFLN